MLENYKYNMNRKLLYLLSGAVCWLLSSCADNLPEDGVQPLPSTGTMPVELSFTFPGYDFPSSSLTRGGGGTKPYFSASSPGMDVELTATPDAETRAPASNLDEAVYGYHVLQFDGTTSNSRLKTKIYKTCPGGVLTSEQVSLSYLHGAKQRIVVITNLADGELNDLVINSTTYSDLQLKLFQKSTSHANFPLYTNATAGNDLIVMCGQVDIIKSTATTQITVPLLRTVSKLRFNLEVGDAMQRQYTNWTAVLQNVPNVCYLNQNGLRQAIFPEPANGYHQIQVANISGDVFPQDATFYVPVNLQPDVPNTEFADRRTNAPAYGTYLEIMGQKWEGTVLKDLVIYQVNLGLNFTDNYSLPPNYSLTYNIRLNGTSDDDSQTVRFIPGYFGGALTAYSDDNATNALALLDAPNAKVWRYARRIEVYSMDAISPGNLVPTDKNQREMRFSADVSISLASPATSLTDGFENTKRMMNSTIWNRRIAAVTCYAGLNGYETNDSASSGYNRSDWYLPAIGQLVGTWISVAGLVSTLAPSYWSSTGDAATIQNAYSISTMGEVKKGPIFDENNKHHVRGVREVD